MNWRSTPADATRWETIHETRHTADRWSAWDGGPGAAQRVRRLQHRVTRRQRDRVLHDLGYRDLGGEA